MFRHCSRFIEAREMRLKVFLSFTFHGGRGVGALLPLSGLWRLTGRQRFSKRRFKDILKPKTLDIKRRSCCLDIKINIHQETGKTVSSSLISLKWHGIDFPDKPSFTRPTVCPLTVCCDLLMTGVHKKCAVTRKYWLTCLRWCSHV